MNDEILIKFLLKETNEQENLQVNEWLVASTSNANYFAQLEQIWNTSNTLAQKTTIDVDAAWLSFKVKAEAVTSKPMVKPLRRSTTWLSIAAALVIGIGAWTFYNLFLTSGYTDITAAHKVTTQILPDGSALTINKNSLVSYAKNFESNRHIQLKKGDVFFKVASDRSHPFVIAVASVKVTVIGTSFNIKHLDERVEVVVESGIVKVARGSQSITLTKDERILINPATKGLVKEQNKDKLYNYYRTGVFDARNTPLYKLVDILNEAYGSHVVVDEKVKNLVINIPLEFGSLPANLKYICYTLDLKISRNQDEIKLSY